MMITILFFNSLLRIDNLPFCQNNDDSDCWSKFQCEQIKCNDQKEEEEKFICRHQTFFEEKQSLNQSLFAVSNIILIGIGNFIGMGGEIAKLPLSIYYMNYPNYDSVIFSYFSTLGSGIIYFIFIKFSYLDQYIDYEMIQIIFPTMIIGTEIGNYINRLLPDFYVIAIISSLFLLILVPFIAKTFRIYQHDLISAKDQEIQQQNLQTYLNIRKSSTKEESDLQILSSSRSQKNESEQKFGQQQATKFVIFGFILYQIAIILRGGSQWTLFPFIKFDNIVFRIYTALIFILCIIAFIVNYIYLHKKDEQKLLQDHYNYVYERRYNICTYIYIWILSILGTFSTGFMGIGNSLLVPIFIMISTFKMNIINACVTQSVIELLMSISTAVQTFLNFTSKYQDIGIQFIFGILGGFLVIVISYFLKNNKFQSTIRAILICIVIIVNIIIGSLYLIKNHNNYDQNLVPQLPNCEF